MEKKNVAEVVIDGSIYRLGGYESSEYIQQVAGYLNQKITEMKALDGYNRLPTSQKALMLQLNAADDYFKARKSVERLQKELEEKDKELYSAKHDLVSLQVKMEEAGRTIQSLRDEQTDDQSRILELETRIRQTHADTPEDTEIISSEKDRSKSPAEEAEGKESLPAEETKPEEDSGRQEREMSQGSMSGGGEEGGTPHGIPSGSRDMTEKKKDLPSGEENNAGEDTGDVFRPEKFRENPAEEVADEKGKDPAVSGGDGKSAAIDRNGRTFAPSSSDRNAMLKNARENYLASGSHGRKNRRRH